MKIDLFQRKLPLFVCKLLGMLLLSVLNDKIMPNKLFKLEDKREIYKWYFLSKDSTKAKAEHAEEDEGEVDGFRTEIVFV